MTLGIGMVPSGDRGVVLVTDSLQTGREPGGRESYWLDGTKLQWLYGSDTVVVISGYVNDDDLRANGVGPDHRPLVSWGPREDDPKARPRRNYARLREIDAGVRARVGGDLYHELDDPGPHVLYAVGEWGREPLLAKFTTKTETWAQPGDVFAIGGWLLGMPADIAEEMRRPAPQTLAACRALAADWVRRFMDTVFGYRDAFAMASETGKMPCIGFPLEVLTMTDELTYSREAIPA